MGGYLGQQQERDPGDASSGADADGEAQHERLRMRRAMQRRRAARAKQTGSQQVARGAEPEHVAPPEDAEHGAERDEPHSHRAIDQQPAGESPTEDWVNYLLDLHRFLRDQTGTEKNGLLDLRLNRAEHPVVGGIADSLATVGGALEAIDDVKRAAHDHKRYQPRYLEQKVQPPDEGIWDQVFAQLSVAHALLAVPAPDVQAARQEMQVATRLFRDAHRRTYEYKTRTEQGGQTAGEMLKGVEIGCDITLAILSMGLGSGSVNVLKLGVRGVFQLAARQTAEAGLVKTGVALAQSGAKVAGVTGLNKLLQGTAEEATAYGMDASENFDYGKILREAGEHAVLNFLGVFIGGALNKLFMRAIGDAIAARNPELLLQIVEKHGIQGIVPSELLVTKGWGFFAGIAGDGVTTTLMTAIATTVEHLRTGGKHPTAGQFVTLVVDQMIRNGLMQLVLTGVTHEQAKAKGAYLERVPHEADGEHEYQYDQMRPGPLSDEAKYPSSGPNKRTKPATGFFGGKYDDGGSFKEPTRAYRVTRKGEKELIKEWWTLTPPQSEIQFRVDSAVRRQWKDPVTGEPTGQSPAEVCVSVVFPVGTRFFRGPIGTQGDGFLGGVNKEQIFIPEAWNVPGISEVTVTPFNPNGHVQ